MPEPESERDRVLLEVKAAHAAVIAEGLAVLERWAGTGEKFSANDVRAELRRVGVTGASSGALFNSAIKAGIITRIGYVRSTDIGTHAKPVMQYVGAEKPRRATLREAVTVPVVRDREGRFSNIRDTDTPTLFEVSA